MAKIFGREFDLTPVLSLATILCVAIFAVATLECADQYVRLHSQRRAAVNAGKAEWYWDKEGYMHWRLLEGPD